MDMTDIRKPNRTYTRVRKCATLQNNGTTLIQSKVMDETFERSRLEKYCRYLNLIPKYALENQTRDELLTTWPLRSISQKCKSAPILIDQASQKAMLINDFKVENGRILNERNSDYNRSLLRLENTSSTFPQSIHKESTIDIVKNNDNNDTDKIKQSSVCNQSSKNSPYSVTCDPQFKEKLKKKMKRLLANRINELDFSSPLGAKLLLNLSLSRSVSDSNYKYERYCSTNSKIFSLKKMMSNFNLQMEPSRTLRSNTSIAEEKAPAPITISNYVHIYTFNKRERNHRWKLIETSLRSKKPHVNENKNQGPSNLVSFTNVKRVCDKASYRKDIQKIHQNSTLLKPSYSQVKSFLRNNFKRPTNKAFASSSSLSSSSSSSSSSLSSPRCGYEIIFTPITNQPKKPNMSTTNNYVNSKLIIDNQKLTPYSSFSLMKSLEKPRVICQKNNLSMNYFSKREALRNELNQNTIEEKVLNNRHILGGERLKLFRFGSSLTPNVSNDSDVVVLKVIEHNDRGKAK